MSRLFLNILNMSLSASWLILAVLLVRPLLKKAPKWVNVLLWGIVALRLLCPISLESGLSLLPTKEPISPQIMTDYYPKLSTEVQAINQAIRPYIPQELASASGANSLQLMIPAAAILWISGVAVLLLYFAISYWRLRRRVATAVRIRRNIYQSEYVSFPFVLGIFKPIIILPYDLPEGDIRHVVAHERAHIQRRDHWWKPLGFLLLSIYWFNPLLWVAYILLCRDIELACDERVIRKLGSDGRADYTQALVESSVNRRMIAACPLAFGELGVKERVKSVMNYRRPSFWIVVGAILICVVVAVCFLTNPRRSDRQVGITGVYGTVLDQGMSVVSEDDREERPYICLRCADGEELLLWASEERVTAGDYLGSYVKARVRTDGAGSLLLVTQVRPDTPIWGESPEEAIENAILGQHRGEEAEDGFPTASFELLATETGQASAPDRQATVTFYGLALYQCFNKVDGQLTVLSGSHIPTALTFAVDEAGRYSLKEYWMPRDGSYYSDDIRAKFPPYVWPDTQKYIDKQKLSNLAKAEAYFLELPPEPSATQVEQPPAASNLEELAYFLELAATDRKYRAMDPGRESELLQEYGALLDGFALFSRESEDGTLFYIAGAYLGPAEDRPFAGLLSGTSGTGSDMVQTLYWEEDSRETIEGVIRIQSSHFVYSWESGLILITPNDTGWDLQEVYNNYLRFSGAYLLDASSRGVALCTPEGPYLEVYLISDKWGELTERLPLTEEAAAAILAEGRVALPEGTGFTARLQLGQDSSRNVMEDALWYNQQLGVPQTVLDLAVERCGYRLVSSRDIRGELLEARLDCSWLDTPLYAKEQDLSQLGSILKNAEFGYVGACGFGAKLTIRLEDGTELVLYKGTDGCDSMVYGSYGGYFIGTGQNQVFWELFGLDPYTHQPK